MQSGKVKMYVCGMTVYDYCHLGHARMLVVFDMVQRWLRASGLDVTYVRNITDIDDKIIRRAQENGEPIEVLTGRFIQAMEEDAAALGVEPRVGAAGYTVYRQHDCHDWHSGEERPCVHGSERRRVLCRAQISRLWKTLGKIA